MPKRKISEISVEDAITEIGETLGLDEGWIDRVEEVDDEALLSVISELCRRRKWTEPTGKKRARTTLPSFSDTTYEDVRAKVNTLPEDPQRMAKDEGPSYRLPVSTHAMLYETVWKALNVYGDRKTYIDNEARRVRTFDAYLVPLLNLFEGRVIDKPEVSLGKRDVSSGGAVEHELCVVGGVLLILLEFKKDEIKKDDIGQLLAEILSAANENKKIPEFEKLRVHGILTNLDTFYFYTFDPTTRTFTQEDFMVAGISRRDFLRKMIPITNKIFSLIFTSYLEALWCTLDSSTRRGSDGDFEGPGSAILSQLYSVKRTDVDESPGTHIASGSMRTSRPSTPKWEQAVQYAQQARALFREQGQNAEEHDSNATKALELLRLSTRMIPRILPSEANCDLDEDAVKKEALEVIKNVYASQQ